eukprot:TRINITY_DN74212_c0_g1_i1.p1 TRINITY_DN74212_c0_g1~~TRINITY_DN74212_c0_g1_i1.p1  ORF type:complete len:650 (+),score=121.26 TRINITY_DN74212_c0_g1_i1:75-1952(+)
MPPFRPPQQQPNMRAPQPPQRPQVPGNFQQPAMACFGGSPNPAMMPTRDPVNAKSNAMPAPVEDVVDHKGHLNQLLQRLLRRPVGPGEVLYQTQGPSPGFTAVVIVTAAVGGDGAARQGPRRFSGSHAHTKKAAEQSAAAKAVAELQGLQALQASAAYQPVVDAARNPNAAKPTKTWNPLATTESSNFKGQLCELLHKYLRRAITREDLRWTCAPEGGNFVASVEIPPLQVQKLFGQGCSTKKAAEQSAAKEAVQRLLARGDILTEKPPKPPQSKASNSQGAGRSAEIPGNHIGCLRHGNKSWMIQSKSSPDHICILNEWCQASQSKLHLDVSVDNDASAGAQGGRDPKTLFHQVLQRILGRPVGIGELLYEVHGQAPALTATVLVRAAVSPEFEAFFPRRFVGNPAATRKDAELSAAAKAVSDLEALPAARQAMQDAAPESDNYKGHLCELLHKHLRRSISREDLLWTYRTEGLVNYASVSIPGLSFQPIEGVACTTKKAAEQSAAQKAIQRLFPEAARLELRPPAHGKKQLKFVCKAWVELQEKITAQASTSSSFSSKQASKVDAAFQLCLVLLQQSQGEVQTAAKHGAPGNSDPVAGLPGMLQQRSLPTPPAIGQPVSPKFN